MFTVFLIFSRNARLHDEIKVPRWAVALAADVIIFLLVRYIILFGGA